MVAFFAGEFGSYNFNFSVPSGNRGGGGSKHFLAFAPEWNVVRSMLPWILLAALAVVILIFLLLYVHSVFRFILFDSVLTGRCRIRESWRRHQDHGAWYFVWLILYELLMMAALFLLVGLPVLGLWRGGAFSHPGEHIVLLVFSIFFMIIFFLAFFLVAWTIGTVVKDFLVPIMALEDLSVVEAWRVYKPILQQAKASAAGYLGMKILLAIGLGILVGIISLFILFLLLVPTVGFGLLIVGIMATGKLGVVIGILLAIVGGTIFIGLMFFASGMLSVPLAVFFQSYALYYVGSRYQRLGELLWPAPPMEAPATGGLPPVNPAPA